jgi:peptidoglycan/xylan/chitin deacetylase (PgdA/CDA1 family)
MKSSLWAGTDVGYKTPVVSTQENRLRFDPIARRAPFRWSNGARLAVWVIPNIEYFAIDKPGTSIRHNPVPLKPDIPNHSWREYGPRVGVWRLMECMEKLGVPGTVALNAAVCDHYPAILEETRRLGWEHMGHGWTNSEQLPGMAEDDERKLLARVRDRMKAFFGAAPRGWLAPALNETWATPDLLKEEGYEYTCDWVHDDQPTWLQTRAGPLMTMPYSIEVNDLPVFLARHQTPEDFRRIICAHAEQLVADGESHARVMAIALHPFIIGAPHRIAALAESLNHLKKLGVWFARAGDIADDFIKLGGKP